MKNARIRLDKISCRQSTLWVLAAPYGGLVPVAVKIGVHPNTLYMAARGVSVSVSTRNKIETFFGAPLEELQRPITENIAGERA